MRNGTALVVTCTKTKSVATSDLLHFGRLSPGPVGSIVEQWLGRAGNAEKTEAAHILYSGEGWAQTRRAWCASEGELFVASAGFGLLRSDELVPPYAATFSPEADRVANMLRGYNSTAEAHQAWWRGINSGRGREALPMCCALGAFERVVVAMSANYFAAARDDLELLARERGINYLFVLATGIEPSNVPDPLRACLLPISVKVESLLSGPRATLNQRALVWLLEKVVPRSGWERNEIEAEINHLLNGVAHVPRKLSQRMSDEDVAVWVRKQWAGESKLGRTALLRRLRDAGYACEQKRFSRLVEAVEQKNEDQARLNSEP